MAKILTINPERCVGCMSCVMACCLYHKERISPEKSRILPIRLKGEVINFPVVCRQCHRPLCAEACPMGAISRDQSTRAMVVDKNVCIGCGMCTVVCPLGGVFVDPEKGHAVKCDLCDGDPFCVKFCTYQALNYIDEDDLTVDKRLDVCSKIDVLFEVCKFQTKGGSNKWV